MPELEERILAMKKEKNAVILAHYYQRPEVQRIADYVGDSYYLSKTAMELEQELIVFCGVRFMAESAQILSPNKEVRLPATDAGCPMASMADVQSARLLISQHPDAAVVCYINSSVEVKALCDVCVTSSNALNIIRKLPQKKIIFLPDRNLASYIAKQCPDKDFIIYPGYCIVHNNITSEEVAGLKEEHPEALVAVHPECRKEVLDKADFVGSTEAILNFVGYKPCGEFIIITEEGIRYALESRNPGKKFYFPDRIPMVCLNMKKTGLEDVLWALEDESTRILVDKKTGKAALHCLEEMHLLGSHEATGVERYERV